jgi:hypothetical protein
MEAGFASTYGQACAMARPGMTATPKPGRRERLDGHVAVGGVTASTISRMG